MLFPFGYGLSYSTFRYGQAALMKTINVSSASDLKRLKKSLTLNSFSADERLELSIPVTNTSERDGEEVVQVYLKKVGDDAGPRLTLRQFRRVRIPAGQTVTVTLPMDEFNFRTFNDATGKMETTPGTYILYYGPSSDPTTLQQLRVTCK